MELDTLRLRRPMMHGPAVVRLQEMGDLLGYDTGPNDGIFGQDTERAVKQIQTHLGLKVDGICGPKTWNALLNTVDFEYQPDPEQIVIDRRGLHKPPKWFARKRDWSTITGITLHQTGCAMPERDSGWDRLNAHIGITRGGKAIICNDPTDMIWHAQKLSHSTVGVEIAGNYYGVDGKDGTLWRGGGGPHNLTVDMVQAIKAAFDWLLDEFTNHGQIIECIRAHRQSKNTRRGDPGEEIWKKIAIPFAKTLGADVGDDVFCYGTGRPLPKVWDSRRTGKY